MVPRPARPLLALAAVLLAVLLAPTAAPAQILQAALGAAASNNEQLVARASDSLVEYLARRRTTAPASFVDATADLPDRAAAVLAVRDDPREFFRRYRALRGETRATAAALVPEARARGQAMLPNPGPGVLVGEALAFTIGYDVAGGSRGSAQQLSLTTNLLGAVAGTAAAAVDASTLADYFQTSISAGAALPVGGGGGRLGAQLGLGLGRLSLGDVELWPVLAMEQVDSAARRVPTEVLARAASQEQWATPVLGIGVPLVPASRLRAHLAAKRLLPVLSVGARFPFYYPGNVFQAIGAVFSDGRSGFVRQGRAQFTASIGVPLFRLDSLQ